MDALLAMAAARLVQFVGAVLVFGGPLFFLYGLPEPEARKLWPRWALPTACAAVAGGALAALALQTVAMTGASLDLKAMETVLVDTTFGRGLAARLFFAALAYVMALNTPGRGSWLLTSVCGAGILASFAFTGHGAANDGWPGMVHIAADIVHLVAAGAWLGALAVLVTLALQRGEAGTAAGALNRFSGLGPGLVAILVLSGVVNTWLLIGPDQVVQALATDYGRLLAIKLGLFLVMLVLAAANRWWIAPRLTRGSARGLALSVGAEAAAGLAVLALVAAMGTMAPPMAG